MDQKVLAIIVIGALHLTLMWFMRGSLKPEELAHGTGMMHPDAAPIEPNPYTAPKVLAADEQETADLTAVILLSRGYGRRRHFDAEFC